MKLSTLAVAVFASTALFSVTSAAGSGGVRGSIDDQTQARSSLDEVCSDCAGCWMSNEFWLPEKCQTQNFFNKEVDLTKADCYNMKNVGLAYGWCAEGIDRDATIDEYIYYSNPKSVNGVK